MNTNKAFFLLYFQKATDVLYKESKDELYRKLLETYEEKKRTGLSTDLLDKLKRRRRLRRMRHQRRSSKRHRKLSISQMMMSPPFRNNTYILTGFFLHSLYKVDLSIVKSVIGLTGVHVAKLVALENQKELEKL